MSKKLLSINVTGMTPRQVCEAIKASNIEFDQLILENVSKANPGGEWIHIGFSQPYRNQVMTKIKGGGYEVGL